MSLFEKGYKRDEFGVFLQMQEESKTDIRYIAVGVIKNRKLSGLVSLKQNNCINESFVFENRFIPSVQSDRCLEHEEQVELLEELTEKNIESKLYEIISEVANYDSKKHCYVLNEKGLKIVDEKTYENNFYIMPLSYGNLIFENNEAVIRWSELDKLIPDTVKKIYQQIA